MSLNWYVIRTIAQHRIEFDVQHALTQHERQAIVPFEVKLVRKNRTLLDRKYPYFPCYVMAAFESPRDFVETRKVVNKRMEDRGRRAPIINIIGPSMERPWVLREDDVRFLQSLSVTKTTEVNIHRAFKVGDDVSILDGVYQGHTAKVVAVDRKRIKAMLMMFGQMRAVEMPMATKMVAA